MSKLNIPQLPPICNNFSICEFVVISTPLGYIKYHSITGESTFTPKVLDAFLYKYNESFFSDWNDILDYFPEDSCGVCIVQIREYKSPSDVGLYEE